MKKIKSICLFLGMAGVLAIGGCGSDSTSNKTQVKTNNDTVFSGQVRALEKAKKVEQLILDADTRQRMAIDKMTE